LSECFALNPSPNPPTFSFRLDADESWSVSANEWGLFTRYFDAPDCVKTLVQWAEEKCIAASETEKKVTILKHPDSDPIKDLLIEVFSELNPSSDSVPDEEPFAAVLDETIETPRRGPHESRAHEIEEVAAFLRSHLFVKVSHLRALSEEDWDKLSRQKIPYRVVKMLQSKVCQIAKCLKCIDYNVIISTSAIQQFCKSKEDALRPSLLSRDASQSDMTAQSPSSREGVSASVQKLKVTKVDLKKDDTSSNLSISALNLNPNPKIPLKSGDKIIIGTSKDSFTVFKVDGNKLEVKRKLINQSAASALESSDSTFFVQPLEPAAPQSSDSPVAAPLPESKKSTDNTVFVANKIYTFEMVSQQKHSAQNPTQAGSGGLPKTDVTDEGTGLPSHSNQPVMPSPRKQSSVPLESPRSSSRQTTSQNADVLSSPGSIKLSKKIKTKVSVSFDDKMLNSTLRVALQFLCDITCKSNKFLDYQRLFMTEKTLKYLIQVVEILGHSEKLLHQEIAVLAVKCRPLFKS
jgi:hypothetical protein